MRNALIERYRALQQGADAWFARCQAAAGVRLRCAGGCSGCCRSLFDITLLDALSLQEGLSSLPSPERAAVEGRARRQLARLQEKWPDFVQPYLLNGRPQAEWEVPEEDDTPCPLLSGDGTCLLYRWRPLTCRLHGLAHIDLSGEVFMEEGCTLNRSLDPRERRELRWEFRAAFAEEARLLRQLAREFGGQTGELDTFVATALLIDFKKISAFNTHWS